MGGQAQRIRQLCTAWRIERTDSDEVVVGYGGERDWCGGNRRLCVADSHAPRWSRDGTRRGDEEAWVDSEHCCGVERRCKMGGRDCEFSGVD